MIDFFKKNNVYLILFLILGITYYIYSPGLLGDYVFDDSANILENKQLAITTLDWNNLKSAFWSGGAGPLGRPISMLSFAFNHYFTGFNPYYFKLTNLFIHLINGVLVYLLSLFILERLNVQSQLKKELVPFLALAVSFIWLIHPINLTSVLYVVQRMTSLSTSFGLLMLVIYCYWRSHRKNLFNTIGLCLGLFISFLASILSKESGLLFLGLLYWIELLIFQGKDLYQKDILIFRFKLINLLWLGLVACLLGVIYIALPYISSLPAGNRDFSTIERLLTESRVIFFYLKMIFFPLLSDLSLYHDDFEISQSLIQPITTLYSTLGLLTISVVSLLCVKKYPLVLFAWGWYLISQLMESTFISLELVHEHRNYFGTIGFIILIIYSIAKIINKKIKAFIILIGAVYITNLMLTTWQRAVIWSNLVDHAAYEAAMHPQSDRANYQMARIYMKLMVDIPSEREKYAQLAYYYLQQSKESYLSSNGAWFGELHLASEMKWPISSKIVNELQERLAHHSFANNNIGFLSTFSDCQIKGFCKVPHEQAVLIIAAGIDNPNVNNDLRAELYKLLANYFVSIIADFKKGEEFMKDAIVLKDDVNGRLLFSQIYRLQNEFNKANEQLEKAKILDSQKIWNNEIIIEQKKIAQREIEFKKGLSQS
jgi:protein O-mannosyl-transferase